MKLPDITHPPAGITILTFFYLLSSIIFAFAMTLFYEYLDVVIFGLVLPYALGIIIKIIFVLLPLYIYFGFTRFRRQAWLVAICYHIFFVANSILHITWLFNKKIPVRPIFQIAAKPTPDFFKSLYFQESNVSLLFFLSTGVITGLAIVIYLFEKEDYFIY